MPETVPAPDESTDESLREEDVTEADALDEREREPLPSEQPPAEG